MLKDWVLYLARAVWRELPFFQKIEQRCIIYALISGSAGYGTGAESRPAQAKPTT
jgi:hypothetical protein